MFRYELARGPAVLIIPSGAEPSREDLRHWVAEALVRVPLLPRSRVALVVEELVSNARRHGGLPCVLRLSLDHTRRFLLVFVDDSATTGTQAWPTRAGLTLVDGLTLEWGVEPRATGKTVWAEVPVGARVHGLVLPPQPLPD